MTTMDIGLALSGGGFRATGFHLGVLARLAKEDRLENVAMLSTVSGGSLCIGLVYALNGYQWPTSQAYLEDVLPRARALLTTQDLQASLIWRALRNPFTIFETRADDLSALMQERWGITASLSALPRHPRWMINATCYETGVNWRFERFRMGDYLFGYSNDTDIPLSDALAASAGFPGLIGALSLDTRPYRWFKYADRGGAVQALADPGAETARKTETVQPLFPTVHLWDGGVYDNHGLEGLHDFIDGWHKDIDFLIVSDAAGTGKPEKYARGYKALLRIITGVMMNQIRSLRSRAILERLINHEDRGGFLQTGNTCSYVLSNAGRQEEIPELCPGCMNAEEARWVADMPTVIRKLEEHEVEKLVRHGFEVADYTLYAYNPDDFNFIGYKN
jgi:NTE family protein